MDNLRSLGSREFRCHGVWGRSSMDVISSEYLSESSARRLSILRVGLFVYFCCLVTSENWIAFVVSGVVMGWNVVLFHIHKVAPTMAFLGSDSNRIPVNIALGQACVLTGSPFGWIMACTVSQCSYYTTVNPYQENYESQLVQVKHWHTINIILTVITMTLTGLPYAQIAQALLAFVVARTVMVKIYEIHSPIIFKLHNTNEEKSAFISVVSHEIRTPLTHIINNVELLESVLGGSEILLQIQRSSELLLRLINNLLNYSKWKAQRSASDTQVLDLRKVFKNIIDQFYFEICAKGIFLDLDFDESMHQFFLIDRLKIEELFLNLVGNAVKFTHEGGITVSLKKVFDCEQSQQIVISVADTGIGISEEGLKELFKPFSQADRKISSKYGGSGLGLSICKEIAECLNGKINVESKPAVGTKMIVSVPLMKASPPIKTHTDPITIQIYPEILLCEDNALIRKAVKQLLHKEGFRDVTVCCDGVELIEAFKSKFYKIVVTDQHMPNMDGSSAIKVLKENYRHFRFKAILLTADVSLDKPSFIDRVLNKPTSGADLKRAILEEWKDLQK